jgi:hypothetical protein
MSLDLSGEITAIATAVLAAFAIVTGIYAVRAFRKQSQEVSDQASMLQIQSEQLAEQRKVNEEQITVLALQAAELRESLDERKREAVERRNAQAAQVHIVLKVVARSREGSPEIEATAVNTSERQQPVYDVKLYWHLGPDSYGTPNPDLLGTLGLRRRASRARLAGDSRRQRAWVSHGRSAAAEHRGPDQPCRDPARPRIRPPRPAHHQLCRHSPPSPRPVVRPGDETI